VTDDDLLALPADPWAREVLDLVTTAEPPAIAHHSVRSYLFARLVAAREGLLDDVDPRLLFAATVLHDIGLRDGPVGPARFEVEGADVAAAFLTARGFTPTDTDQVWEAIALHTSPGIAERRGPLAYLTREGVGTDFGRHPDLVTAPQATLIHTRYPRLHMATTLIDTIVTQCHTQPTKAPRYTLPGELTRERATPPHTTDMERAAASSHWAD
jgi:HD domain-containing protein